MHIVTPRLRLRPVVDADLATLVRLHQDPQTMRFITGGRPESRETVRDRVLPAMTRHYDCIGAPGYWAAEDLEDSRFVGWFELRPVDADSHEVLELGYRIERAEAGRGYATEGSMTLVDIAFAEFRAEIVTANTMTVNTSSRRVMEKCGLTHVRTFTSAFDEPCEGMEHGEVEYQLTRQQWSRRPLGRCGSVVRPSSGLEDRRVE